jgi:hypothetical protein
MFDLFLDKAFFLHGFSGEAQQDRVAGSKRFFDFQFPILAGEELFFIQPRIETV